MISDELARQHPNLRADGGKKTSGKDPVYNCVAWAAKRDKYWWWQPGAGTGLHWPAGVRQDPNYGYECFVELFESRGYERCNDFNYQFEIGYEKIVIYSFPDGEFSHVAKQLSSGKWTSKLGPDEDIRHNTPHGLEDKSYGSVKQLLRKQCNPPWIITRWLLRLLGLAEIGDNIFP